MTCPTCHSMRRIKDDPTQCWRYGSQGVCVGVLHSTILVRSCGGHGVGVLEGEELHPITPTILVRRGQEQQSSDTWPGVRSGKEGVLSNASNKKELLINCINKEHYVKQLIRLVRCL